jgi:hypothetical protein
VSTPRAKALADEKVTHLFNGHDLANFYTWLGPPSLGAQPYGKNNDPESVFTVRDGMIRISGKVFGGLTTEKEYENYHLLTEFKWGEKTWPPRQTKARSSGILLHCVGDDGAAGGMWMQAIACQIIEGGTGDLNLVTGKNKPKLAAFVEKRDDQYYAVVGRFGLVESGKSGIVLNSGRVNWYGRDPSWKDVKGFRGAGDVEKPVGEWNTLECNCSGNLIQILLNGKVVNECQQVLPTKGKILLQSAGAEVFFRKIDLKALTKD